MKLIRIGIRNLNSLRGDQEVDFRKEPLASSGLYAIVGPTGAGKTSILDAITLALYGRTERDRYGNEVMSHGTGDCFAEVEFSNDHGRYLSRWERRRARSKPDGKLQTAERSLSEWNEIAGEYQPVDNADGLRGVNERTEAVLGLDYARFVRSVMLTQGQFARFLESDVSERSGVLERITGTEIYSQISEAAFLRHKLANDDYLALKNQLELQPPLAAEVRRLLIEQLKQAEATSLHLRPRLKNTQSSIGLYAKEDELVEGVGLQTAALNAQQAAWVAAAGDRKKLSESLRLQPLRSPLMALNKLEAEQAVAEKNLSGAAAAQAKILPRVTTETEAVTAAESKLARHQKERPEKLAKLEEAEALERQVAGLTGAEKTEALRRNSLAQIVKISAHTVHVKEQRMTTLREKSGGIDPDGLEAELAVLEEKQPTLDAEVNQLTAWRNYLIKQQEHATAAGKVGSVKEQLTTAEAGLAAASKERTKGEELLALREKSLRQKERDQSLDHLRNELPEGQPCPVCGATHHPDLVDHEPTDDADIRLARTDMEAAGTSLRMAKNGEQQALLARQKNAEQLAAAKATATNLASQTKQLLPGGSAPAGDLSAIDAQRTTQNEKLLKGHLRLKVLREIRSLALELNDLQKTVALLNEQLNKDRAEYTKLASSGKERALELQQLEAKKSTLIGKYTVSDCRKLLADHDQKCQEKVASVRAVLEQVKQQAAAAASTLQARKERLQELVASRTQITTELSKVQAALGGAELSGARAALLPLVEEELLRKQVADLEQSLLSQRAQLERLTEAQTAHQALMKGLPDLEALRESLVKDELAYAETEQLVGKLRGEITRDDAHLTAAAAINTQLEASKTELNRWAKLHELIGQKDGTKFRRYAQTLTLQRLVEAGNFHLNSISGRYQMRHKAAARLDKEALELEIIDTFQNDNRRPTSTLSGGETFIVSLALALGLSDLAAGKQVIQSLFIDEGFGTLDEKVLDQAMTTLEQLQAQGKTIGLISHVKELRERIHCQIQLEPVGDGFSEIKVLGA
jgi:exonuclease SbcC